MYGDNGYRAALVVLVLLIAVTAGAACGEETAKEDEWENYHNSYQPPDSVMDAIGVKPGMMIGEVGAGRGRYVVHMARRVGEKGKIYANDIDSKALIYLQYRCMRDSIPNVVTILGDVTDPRFPEGTLDMVYIINTYHHLEKPVELLRNIRPGLKPGGTLVIIEHDPEKYPAAGSHSTPRRVLIDQAVEAGFELIRIETFLARDNINIFRPRD